MNAKKISSFNYIKPVYFVFFVGFFAFVYIIHNIYKRYKAYKKYIKDNNLQGTNFLSFIYETFTGSRSEVRKKFEEQQQQANKVENELEQQAYNSKGVFSFPYASLTFKQKVLFDVFSMKRDEFFVKYKQHIIQQYYDAVHNSYSLYSAKNVSWHDFAKNSVYKDFRYLYLRLLNSLSF